MDLKLLETALRVLNAYTACEAPAAKDVEKLREATLLEERGLPADLLATRIVERELAKVRNRRSDPETGNQGRDCGTAGGSL